jgi:magnesium chelatase subunit I
MTLPLDTPRTGAQAPEARLEPASRAAFPFSALVGQPVLQRALLLAAIDPGIGGVLISGPRGTAKSTAARALGTLLPQAPFVTLPLAASLEQLVGTLSVEDALRDGRLRLSPGLIAKAHEGVLYVDEVNLLPDALVDALLDVAASGVNTVERDGISRQHAARFVLVGTMNPEEGELRPQLLDRFGLSVTLANPLDLDQRQAILRARLSFDSDPHGQAEQHAAPQDAYAARVAAARAALPRLNWTDAVLRHAAGRALAAGVDGVRADLVMLRAARAQAAFDGRDAVRVEDVDAVAELALAHRRPFDAPSAPSPAPTPAPAPSQPPPPSPAPRDPGGSNAAPGDAPPSAPPDTATETATTAEGDWGALPAQPEALLPVTSGARFPKKA